MARVLEKEEKKEAIKEGSRTVIALLITVAAIAVLAFIVVIVVLSIKNKNNQEEDETKKYDATYTLDNTDNTLLEITLDDLEGLLDNDDRSKYAKSNVYVLVYTPNYDNYKTDDKEADGSTKEFQDFVINAIKGCNGDTEDETVLYVINLLSDSNKESESTVLSDNSITYPNGYVLLEIKLKVLEEKMTSYADVTECLASLASNE